MTEPRRLIDDPYLLVLNIGLHRHRGDYWAEPLWHKDLLIHLDEIERLTLFCPVRRGAPPPGWRRCSHPRLTIVPIAPMGRLAMLRAPFIAARLWHAIGAAAIVHVGVAGWPFPLGWLAVPLARWRRRFLVIVVESSFWRAGPAASLRTRAQARLFEAVNCACVNACDLSLFTTEAYRRDFATRPRGAALVAPASWLDQDQVLAPETVAARRSSAPPARLIYAGRLTEAKGVAVLLRAAAISSASLDIVGAGDLFDACELFARSTGDRVRVLPPVEYGGAFSELLDRYVAIIVPSLTDEQPRVLFDAFARAVPAIASDRPGNVALVRDGDTGWLVAAGDADALARAMDEAVARPDLGEARGLHALDAVRCHTHQAMHRDRALAIRERRRTVG